MARECPSCHRISPVDAPYCPACGAPMTEEAVQARENARVNSHIAALLPMKWHWFLIIVSLPLGLIMGCVNLYDTVKMFVQFDAALFKPEMLGLVKVSMGLNALMSVVLLPMLAVTLLSLVRMKKRGPKMLLWVYLLQAVYGAVNFFLLMVAGTDTMTLVNAVFSTLEMALMCLLNNIYYQKRMQLFH